MVNKQDQRTMKTGIKYFWPFRCFRIEGQKFGPFLQTKYNKNQSYQNMSIIKVGLLFKHSSMKKNQMDSVYF